MFDILSNNKFNSGQDLAYPFAKTAEGELIFIEQAQKHLKYYCWGCERPIFLRKGIIRTPHFYHKSSTCSFESALHNAFKRELFKRIEAGLKQNKELVNSKTQLIIQWYCDNCHIQHDENLLDSITDIKMETYVDAYRPDISLYREDGSPSAIIEIECSHALEDNARQYYNNKKIGIITFKPLTREDLNTINDNPLRPNSCNLCQFMVGEEEIINNIQEEPVNYTYDQSEYSQINKHETGNGFWGKVIKGIAKGLIIFGVGYLLYKELKPEKKSWGKHKSKHFN